MSVGIFKGRDQSLDRLHDRSCCMLLHSDTTLYVTTLQRSHNLIFNADKTQLTYFSSIVAIFSLRNQLNTLVISFILIFQMIKILFVCRKISLVKLIAYYIRYLAVPLACVKTKLFSSFRLFLYGFCLWSSCIKVFKDDFQ